jgi:hypothetical protein
MLKFTNIKIYINIMMFVIQLKAQRDVGFHENIITFHGITEKGIFNNAGVLP